MKKALVLAGSRGIGKAIADSLASIEIEVDATDSKMLDTSNMKMVADYLVDLKSYDILVLNTGGPVAKDFYSITEDEWNKYHNQLFLSFCTILKNININNGGYIFLISSFNIKEPDPKLILSNAYRVALTSVLKSLSKTYAARNISCINIAPGPMKTDRLMSLVDDMEEFEKSLPMGRAGDTKEIGNFVKSIVEHNIKYLSGVTINFDGAASNSLF
jgi:3-oxoacyl-[acyl-carrier protein] reductase